MKNKNYLLFKRDFNIGNKSHVSINKFPTKKAFANHIAKTNNVLSKGDKNRIYKHITEFFYVEEYDMCIFRSTKYTSEFTFLLKNRNNYISYDLRHLNKKVNRYDWNIEYGITKTSKIILGLIHDRYKWQRQKFNRRFLMYQMSLFKEYLNQINVEKSKRKEKSTSVKDRKILYVYISDSSNKKPKYINYMNDKERYYLYLLKIKDSTVLKYETDQEIYSKIYKAYKISEDQYITFVDSKPMRFWASEETDWRRLESANIDNMHNNYKRNFREIMLTRKFPTLLEKYNLKTEYQD